MDAVRAVDPVTTTASSKSSACDVDSAFVGVESVLSKCLRCFKSSQAPDIWLFELQAPEIGKMENMAGFFTACLPCTWRLPPSWQNKVSDQTFCELSVI
jgi:hypothetical protein